MNKNTEELRTKANTIIKVHSGLAAIAALSPIPITDVAGIGGVQLTMLIRITKLYGIEADLVYYKNMITGVLGGLITGTILSWASSVVKVIPVIGTALGTVIQAPLAFVITYAIGKSVLFFLEKGNDIKTVQITDLQAKAKEYISEGKDLFKQEGKTIMEKQQDEEYIKQQFTEINDILKPFLKSEEFIRRFTGIMKDAFILAIEDRKLTEELKKLGEEINKGGKNE